MEEVGNDDDDDDDEDYDDDHDNDDIAIFVRHRLSPTLTPRAGSSPLVALGEIEFCCFALYTI